MEKFYLSVPYSEKDEAKSKGARWNPEKKMVCPTRIPKYSPYQMDLGIKTKPSLQRIQRILLYW